MNGLVHGLNAGGGQVSHELNASNIDVIQVPIGVLTGEWFVRVDKNSPLIGPMSKRDADRHARFLSADDSGIGLAQVVTLLGNRGGDPITNPPKIFVDGYYARGKKFLGGKTAQYHSDEELLEFAPDCGIRLYGYKNK